jgi:hypothetical protein
MAITLKTIWKERHKIVEGIKNSIIRDQFVEEVAAMRYAICDECPSKGKKCAVKGTAPCCNECGCSLGFKTRSLASDCPLGKWEALISEEEEDALDNLKD